MNDANVVTADVAATNGIIHVIDKVLMPPADLVDIPTVATGTGIHTALVAALTQANLVSTRNRSVRSLHRPMQLSLLLESFSASIQMLRTQLWLTS